MMFFRFHPGLRWEGAVHERLTGLDGKRIALPYIYAHYGHTLSRGVTPKRDGTTLRSARRATCLREDELE